MSIPDSGRPLYFSGGHSMTDQALRDALVARINLSLDLPFIGEDTERVAIEWVVDKVVPLIPESIRQFVLDAADGVSDDELKRLEDVLVNVLNTYIDIPWMPESIEAQLIRPVVQSVLDVARPGVSL